MLLLTWFCVHMWAGADEALLAHVKLETDPVAASLICSSSAGFSFVVCDACCFITFRVEVVSWIISCIGETKIESLRCHHVYLHLSISGSAYLWTCTHTLSCVHRSIYVCYTLVKPPLTSYWRATHIQCIKVTTVRVCDDKGLINTKWTTCRADGSSPPAERKHLKQAFSKKDMTFCRFRYQTTCCRPWLQSKSMFLLYSVPSCLL